MNHVSVLHGKRVKVPDPVRIVCKRCGQCCTYEKEGKLKRCRFLIGSKITSCRIYKNQQRIGKEIDEGIFCNPRALDKRIFEGCPFNELQTIS